ncbi:peptidoglycan DD-metalloendopeptidase family protein [Thorsellia kenyensis]|uniref:Peptidoglycan DD-metalloendopeptidase family protein n=1 Tax=Thorsellia kenyensis TaxID=1549888 RepID=A0ABV6CAH7_9GAMM
MNLPNSLDVKMKNKQTLNRLKLTYTLPAILVSIILSGCARNEGPAPVVSVNGNVDSMAQSGQIYQQEGSGSVGIVPLQPEGSSSSFNTQQSTGYQPMNLNSQPVQNTPNTQYNQAMTTSQVPQRDYNSIPKGSFSGTTYTVQPGDTLFYVAWITGSNVNELASLNGLTYPYALNSGQQLTISNQVNPTTYNSQQGYAASSTFYTNSEPQSQPQAASSGKMLSQANPAVSSTSANMSSGSLSQVSSKGFRWPTEGNVILGFSKADGGSKGIEISGVQGQPVFASKGGKVVYAGNALAGYGNLIIINHDDEYLSAYAHNDTIMITEGESVQGGQQIATMGNTGTDRVKLYFEIRYKGVSTDPIPFLPAK